jgi:hypothetical protein
VDPGATTRERFRQHTDSDACRSCHQYIDGVGFGFERFDAIGRFRSEENGLPIDPDGHLNDVEGLGTGTGAPFGSLAELGELLARSTRAQQCFAMQYYRFATGSLETPEHACTLGQLEARFAESGHDILELMVGLTQLESFTRRR